MTWPGVLGLDELHCCLRGSEEAGRLLCPSQYAPSNQIKSELWGNWSWHVEKLRLRRRFRATFLAFVSLHGHLPMTASLICRAFFDLPHSACIWRRLGYAPGSFAAEKKGELPRVIPGGMLFRKVPGLPCQGAFEKTTTACDRAGQVNRPAAPVQPVQPQSADASAAGTASPVGHPKPGRVPSGVGGIWREVTSCSLAGCMAVTSDNGFGLRCIP
jgi:hypothetical protein